MYKCQHVEGETNLLMESPLFKDVMVCSQCREAFKPVIIQDSRDYNYVQAIIEEYHDITETIRVLFRQVTGFNIDMNKVPIDEIPRLLSSLTTDIYILSPNLNILNRKKNTFMGKLKSMFSVTKKPTNQTTKIDNIPYYRQFVEDPPEQFG